MRYVASIILIPFLFIFTSCKRSEIEYYEIPKQTTKVDSNQLPEGHPEIPSTHFGEQVNNTQQLELKWIAPGEWIQGPASSMRIVSYLIEGQPKQSLDISVTKFPGDVGGLFSNVNRWRRQLGLHRIMDPTELDSMVEELKTEHFNFKLVDLESSGEKPLAMKVAILDLNGFTWFVKILGEKHLVMDEQERYEQFVHSIELLKEN